MPAKSNPYEIASPDYVVLAEKSLDYFADFKMDSFASMLAEDVVFELPDGRKISGKVNLINYWKEYKKTTGLESMRILNANYLPINSQPKFQSDARFNVKVLTDFTNKMTFEKREILLKMNFSMHFNDTKMIDKIITNYDSSHISLN